MSRILYTLSIVKHDIKWQIRLIRYKYISWVQLRRFLLRKLVPCDNGIFANPLNSKVQNSKNKCKNSILVDAIWSNPCFYNIIIGNVEKELSICPKILQWNREFQMNLNLMNLGWNEITFYILNMCAILKLV